MSKTVYVAAFDMVAIRYRDDEEGESSWMREGDPVIDDIEQGLPMEVDRIKKGEEFTAARRGDPDWEEYQFGDSAVILVDRSGMARVEFEDEGWDGDDDFVKKEAEG